MDIKRVCMLALAMLMLPVAAQAAAGPPIDAAAAILIEKTTGTVLYEKHADERRIPASITKIMTVILAIENSDPEDVITVNPSAVKGMLERGGSCYLIAGEEAPFEAVVRYTLLVSGNDGANALAEHVSGSLAQFVKLMNEKAGELGMTETRFGNAHGLNVIDHYSTARDIATLSMYAMENENFRQVAAETSFVFPATNKHESPETMYTLNFMRGGDLTDRYLYPGITGIKTGWVGKGSGQCFSGTLEYQGLEYYAVVLGCDYADSNDFSAFPQTAMLFDYAKSFSPHSLIEQGALLTAVSVRQGKGGGEAPLAAAEGLTALMPRDYDPQGLEVQIATQDGVQAPVALGQVLGSATAVYQGKAYGTVDLMAAAEVPRAGLLTGLGPYGIVLCLLALGLGVALGIKRSRKG